MKEAVHLSTFLYKGRERLRISFRYSYRLKEHVKAFPGAKWDPKLGFWRLDDPGAVAALTAHLRDGGFGVSTQPGPGPGMQKPLRSVPHPLALRFRDYLIARRYSQSTVGVYGAFIQQFLDFLGDTPPEQATNAEAEAFLEYLVLKRRIAISTHRQAIGALKQFAAFLPDSPLNPEGLVRPRRSHKLPSVLGEAEVVRLLQVTRNLKHRAILALMYSCGLRIGELLNLEWRHIDLERRQVWVRSGKGRKDRQVVLANRILPLLENYRATYQPVRFFAEGAPGNRYSPSSIRAFLRRSAKRAGILKHVTPHTLRHSYATHLLEKGVDIRYIQELLGHAKTETTMVYTHVSRRDLLNIRSPLDLIYEPPEAPDRSSSTMRLSGEGLTDMRYI
jgi:site-specific recombinase XerD